MRRRTLRLAVAALVLAQIVVGWIALSDRSDARDAPSLPVTPATTPVEPLTIESALALSDPVARSWDPAAQLVSASMEVLWPDDGVVVMPSELPGGGALTIVYAGEGSQLSVIMDRQSGVVFHAEVGRWSDELAAPLPIARITRSSSIAVLAAEVSYGTSYRAACPEYRYVTRVHLTVGSGDPGNPTWIVSYVDERHRDRMDVQIAVDAATGETTGGQAFDLSCREEE